MENDLIT